MSAENDLFGKRVLNVLHGLSMDVGNIDKLKPSQNKAFAEIVFKFTHLTSGCKNEHHDWRAEFVVTEGVLIEQGLISPVKEEPVLLLEEPKKKFNIMNCIRRLYARKK